MIHATLLLLNILGLLKASLLNAAAVGIKMLTMLGINKILAVYIGPAGYAAIGQFQNAVQMIGALASGPINTGVTKYTAEYHENEDRQKAVWQTAGTLALIISLTISSLVYYYRGLLSKYFLQDVRFEIVFVCLSVTFAFSVFNTFFLAVVNGKKDIYRYVFANIATSILGLVVTAFLAIKWNLLGALIALTIYPSLAFFVTVALCARTSWMKVQNIFGYIDISILKNLGKYTVMAMVTAIMVPFSHILIRDSLSQSLGIEAAGYWEAMWRLSAAYLMVASTTLGVYYLPRLSELKTREEIRKEVITGYKLILPVVFCLSVVICIFREYIILNLFTREFSPMAKLFFWQLVGDVLKIASWLMSYIMLAKAMMWAYIISEILISATFYFLISALIDVYGLESASIAHAIVYCIYLGLIYFLLRKKQVI